MYVACEPVLFIMFYLVSIPCCLRKQVGGETFTLFPSKEADSSYGCLSTCVYEKDSVPGSEFCFKEGEFEAICLGKF